MIGGVPSVWMADQERTRQESEMDERCIECPWFDREKEVCCRKAPRFCEVDEAPSASQPTRPVSVGGLDTRAA